MTRDAVISTARLTLRRPRPGDAEAVAAALVDPEVARWLPRLPHPYGIADARAFISRMREADSRAGTRFVFDAEGLCGAVGIDGHLGYWLARRVWGRGYATEAVAALLDHHFSRPEAALVVSGYLDGNAASARVLAKLGFSETGVTERVWSHTLGAEMPLHPMILTPEQWHALNPWLIETDRLILRPIRQSDAARVAAFAATPEVAAMMRVIPIPWPETDVLAWIESARWRGKPGFGMAITLKSDGTLIGTLGMGGEPVTTGYMLDSAHWGQGYMTEAMRAFLAACFGRFDLDAIAADHFVDNAASGRVLEKLGFRRTGTDIGTSQARLEPAPRLLYRLERADLEAGS